MAGLAHAMTQPRLLDLFCGAGGCSVGYARAGFHVEGVDITRQPRYPFDFEQADAFDVLADHEFLELFDVIHASPPCQAYSITQHSHSKEHPDLLAPTREALIATGLPYIIENVPGAPMRNPVTLCGAAFGLTADDEDGTRLVLRRHRLFESNVWLWPVECECLTYTDRGFRIAGAYGGGSADRVHAQFIRRGGYTPAKDVRAALLGVTWDMTIVEMSQTIPPAYTQHLGEQLIESIAVAA